MALPASTTTYTVKATDSHGCAGEGHITITVPQPFTVQLPATAELCKGASVQLNATGAQTYQWINTTTGLSNTAISNPVAIPVTNTVYTVMGYDQYNCYSDMAEVAVIVRPLPGVNAGPDKEAIFGQETLLGTLSTSDITRWNWAPRDFLSCTTCATPVSRPYSTIDYVVTVYNAYNCSASDTIRVKASCGGDHVYIPNVFTPDRDGKNDVFTIHGSGISNILTFRIYNRWGEIVFERKNFHPNDLSSAWNGTFKGVEAPTGVYVYFAEMECSSGEKFERKGTVLLTR
jgi:gliding motility-associated-like protein